MSVEQLQPESIFPTSFSMSNYPESDESSEQDDDDGVSDDPCDYGDGTSEKRGGGTSSDKSSYEDSGSEPIGSWEEPDEPWKWK